MEHILLGVIAMGLLAVLVLVIYLVDRVNALERLAQTAPAAAPGAAAASLADTSGPFAGLEGSPLWDVLTGAAPGATDPTELTLLRQRFEPVLMLHIEALFEEGRQDARAGRVGSPRNPRRMNTSRGAFNLWIPEGPASVLYQCGLDYIRKGIAQWSDLRLTLDAVGASMLGQLQMPLNGRLSDRLMGPDPDAVLPAPESEQALLSSATASGADARMPARPGSP
jgi:hypothetical protein